MRKRIYLIFLIGLTLNHETYSAVQVPPGFEELAQGQILWLDVSIYGKNLGLFQANVNLETVKLLDAPALVRAVKENYSDSPELLDELTSSLGNALARNGNLSCSTSGNAPGCDFVETKTVAVIYDENNARLSLFLNPHYLPRTKQQDPYYQATVEAHNGLVHQQNINFVADRSYQSASVQGNGSLGITQAGFVNVDWTWQGQRYRSEGIQKAEVNNAYFRQDLWKRVYLQAGEMDSRDIFSNAGGNINLSQLPIGKIQGVRAGSTLAWINQDRVSKGTPVNVFLSREARVDAYRDGQLLTSFYLAAGAQSLDTRTFPTGSYTVTLRIYEDNQLVRTQTVPYTGTGSAPANTFQWFIQAGRLDDRTTGGADDNGRVLHAGIRTPVTANLAFTAGTAVLDNINYWEGAADWSHAFSGSLIDGTLTSRLSYLHGSDESRGNIQQLNYNDGFSLSFYRSSASAKDCNSQGEYRYSNSGCYKSTNFMLSVPVSQWYANLGYSLTSNEGRYVYRRDLTDGDINYQSGAPWEQIYATRSRSATWQVGGSRNFNFRGMNLNTNLSAFMRDESGSGRDKGGFMSVTLNFASHRLGDDARTSTSLGASLRGSQQEDRELSYNAAWTSYADNNGGNEVGASLYGANSRVVTASGYGRKDGQYGNGTLTFTDAYDNKNNSHTFSSSGSYNSSLVVDRSGLVWGRWGDGTPSSAITLGVDTPDEDSATLVNASLEGGSRADVGGDSRAVFTVPGYRQATFNITESSTSPRGIGSEISKGAGTRSVFMMPGKVFSRNVEVSSRYTWLGRLTDTEQRPLEGGIPLNVVSWTPLSKGGFTLETSHPLKMLYVMQDDVFWACRMKVRAVRDVVRWVGNTECQSTTLASLPGPEQKQVELMMARRSQDGTPTVKNN